MSLISAARGLFLAAALVRPVAASGEALPVKVTLDNSGSESVPTGSDRTDYGPTYAMQSISTLIPAIANWQTTVDRAGLNSPKNSA